MLHVRQVTTANKRMESSTLELMHLLFLAPRPNKAQLFGQSVDGYVNLFKGSDCKVCWLERHWTMLASTHRSHLHSKSHSLAAAIQCFRGI